jgi:endoglucanase
MTWQEGNLLYTKAADDLIGCFAILQTALFKPKNFIGLLTRAEEVGFIGAIAHLEWAKKWGLYGLNRKKNTQPSTLAVSLETSRQLPGAEIGKGPIVRLGDRMHVFSTGPTKILADLAEHTLKGAHQKRVMDGGACEGSATVSYGLPTIALSIPLGNYHNQSLEGGPEARHPNGPAPEFVNVKDLEGMLTLCRELVKTKVDWSKPYQATQKEFVKSLRSYQKLKLI